jgi:hypothetical protein
MTRVPQPRVRRNYPGMNSSETKIIRGYIREVHGDEDIDLFTNVPIGTGKAVSDLPENFRRMARELSRLRADAVLKRGDRTEIIEVKQRIRTTGLGQLNLYNLVKSPEVDIPDDATLVLLGTRVHDEVAEPLRQLGVVVHVIPDSQLPLF